jgi:hypothetical protein
MTATRQFGKEKPAPIAVFALVLCPLAGAPLAALAGGITERIVVDRFTGLAIDGYDPVAFYTDGKPIPGSPDFELPYGGAVWRFTNFGNRAAFAARPDVYMPRFGGYDPVGVAHGVAVAGRPDIWLMRRAALFVLRQPSARQLRRRPRTHRRYGGAKVAGGALNAQPLEHDPENRYPLFRIIL